MAQKRMFDKAVIDTDRFMDLPVSAKALYFLLGMEADDEGFVSYKKVLRIHGGNEDDILVLTAKNFVIKFETGVVVITDWRKNNWLDSRRIKPTEYVTEKDLLAITKENQYMLSVGLADAKREESRVEEYRREEREEKTSPDKPEKHLSYLKNIPEADQKEFVEKYRIDLSGLLSKAEDMLNYCESKGKRYKNYKALLANAIKKDFGVRTERDKELEERIRLTRESDGRSSSFAKTLAAKMKM